MPMTVVPLVSLLVLAANSLAATDVRVNFTLNTTDENGQPLSESRTYYVYRPEGLSRASPIPMILVMEAAPGSGPAGFFHRKADQEGFVVVSCAITGNTLGSVWNNDNPRITGFEDMDYTTTVIERVRSSENCNDAFICGLSKGGHMAYAYACERPATIRAACSVDEFMGLTSNIPSAPLPVIAFHGTSDTSVPYTMAKDSVDAWCTINGLLGATPVTTYESSPLVPGGVTQATWRGGIAGTQVAFVTIIGGGHQYALPGAGTGYDCTDGMWAFFSQFLTAGQGAPTLVSQPVNNVQVSGQPASFWVAATGEVPLGYQWQRNGVEIPGATAAWYTTPATTLEDSGAVFRAVVTNKIGSATSDGAILTVKAAPSDPRIVVEPADQAVLAGQPVTFSVDASGTTPLSYQWKKNGVEIPGATAASLNLAAAIGSDCGATFRVVVSNPSGRVTSAAGTLTVTPAPGAPILIANPVRVRVLAGRTGTFSVVAWSRTPVTYQWQKGTFLTPMADIPGAAAASYTPPATMLADHLTLFRSVVSNAAGSVTSASEMLMVTTAVKSPTDITSAVSVSAQVGAPFRYTLTSSGGTAPVTFSAGPLPAGLSLDTATGMISGVPTTPGTTQVQITASNSAGSTSATLALTVATSLAKVQIGPWRSSHFGASATHPDIAGDAADPDGDDANNLLEYERGTDPLSADP